MFRNAIVNIRRLLNGRESLWLSQGFHLKRRVGHELRMMKKVVDKENLTFAGHGACARLWIPGTQPPDTPALIG